MSTYTDLKCWFDTGYTDGSSEIPPVGHTLGTPDLTFAGPFVPSKDRLFTELQLPEEFTDLLNVSYIQLTLNLNNGLSSVTLYGWVDDVMLHSDSSGKPMTIIRWHVDMWRTFNSAATYGSGHVIRRPSTGADFYQNYPHRHLRLGSVTSMVSPTRTGYWWVILAVQEKTGDKVSQVSFYTYPVSAIETTAGEWIKDASETSYMNAPSYYDTIYAKFDEKLGINPESITGAWVTPFSPISSVGGSAHNFDNNDADHWKIYHHTGGASAFRTTEVTKAFITSEHTVNIGTHTCTEEAQLRVVGSMGETLGTIPFGMTFGPNIKWRLKLTATAAVVEIRAGDTSATLQTSNCEGLCFVCPLDAIDVNGNSWSAYVFSGQRDYDITQRSQRSESSMIEGTIGGVAGGVGWGALIGGPIGAAVGAFAGGIGSLVGGALDLTVYNDRFQKSEDEYHAKQPDAIIMSGFGGDAIRFGSDRISLAEMIFDTVSQAVIADIKTVQGVKYNAPVADCTALITAGGPLQISNLIVKGDIPTVAKKWIKQKFADGVRIIARS